MICTASPPLRKRRVLPWPIDVDPSQSGFKMGSSFCADWISAGMTRGACDLGTENSDNDRRQAVMRGFPPGAQTPPGQCHCQLERKV
eukprot:g59628.t1